MSDLESRLRKLEDADAIRALKSRYFFCCDRKDPKGMRACFADGKVIIDYGAVGVFDNADAVVKVFTDIGCHDYMVEMHHGMNPQIDVIDDTHAKGKWSLHYFLINTQTKSLTQLGGQYEDEYRKVNGAWKISGTKFTPTSTLAMDLSEVTPKTLFAGRTQPPM
ncbi:MAG TPA: nuclear transport factor 2 family protein [Nevskiaceae bacterium]|nr:nuclear transport factor 2 family protein [Nevskiaceae bacterium]